MKNSNGYELLKNVSKGYISIFSNVENVLSFLELINNSRIQPEKSLTNEFI